MKYRNNEKRGLKTALLIGVAAVLTGLYMFAVASGAFPSIPDRDEFRSVYGAYNED